MSTFPMRGTGCQRGMLLSPQNALPAGPTPAAQAATARGTAPGVQHSAPCGNNRCSSDVAPLSRAPRAHPRGRKQRSGRPARCCELKGAP